MIIKKGTNLFFVVNKDLIKEIDINAIDVELFKDIESALGEAGEDDIVIEVKVHLMSEAVKTIEYNPIKQIKADVEEGEDNEDDW